ncbi:threonine aldolase [Pseudidiomarina salinarum]|uniref:Threonine aldolase n=1 Tax=Pseudidiomarina salinarum TaxID=435908 RepID=A0A094ITX6_9GAMM|nr:low-specificity L-threonine aldolase [Pseudidiomarina salinarum]KFZ31130.1 threonine aldolase [Pseudidiomarina salinarum]RUO71214.1 low-specificity L-threonine aldolase [Pseudidiomarina salinarum]
MIDLRSDTVTRPSTGMRQAMADAPVGDDVFGDDPTVNAVQQRVAELTGKEAGLFASSGTQTNLLALLSHCQRGDEYLVGQEYHTYRYEAGGAAVLGGIVPQPFEVEADGTLNLQLVEKRIKPDDPHFPITRLLALENTHTGKVIPQQYMLKARKLADKHGLKLHLDGARIFNASVATGLDLAELAAPFDSVSLCFSKGMGTPIGSVLVGSKKLIQRAHRLRKMLGGGMRQAGIIAAAVDYALDHNFDRLADDHANALELASALKGLPGIVVEPAQTNMVYVNFESLEAALNVSDHLRSKDILTARSQRMRLVTHLNVSRSDIEQVVRGFRKALGS